MRFGMTGVTVMAFMMPRPKGSVGTARIDSAVYNDSLRVALLQMAKDARDKDKNRTVSPEETVLANIMVEELIRMLKHSPQM
jgi:hypothetical protein